MKFLYNVVCVGAGGTGSFFLKEFARFMASYMARNFDKFIYLSIIDGDHVEKNNLERQAFIDSDINSNKAVTMTTAIKENFGLECVYAYPIYIDTVNQLEQVYERLYEENQKITRRSYECQAIDILIGSADNHRVRQVMHEFFYNHRKTIFYYDAANEYLNGEVVFAGRHEGKLLGQSRADYFQEVLTDESPRASEISCGAVNKSTPQHIATNMMAGNLLLSRLSMLIAENKMEFGIAYFDAANLYVNFYPDKENQKKWRKEKRARKAKQDKAENTKPASQSSNVY